jgi:hypothetical protein
MGGEGSGRWNDYEKRRTVEQSWTLDIATLSLRGSLSYPLTGTSRAIRIMGNTNVLPVRYALEEDDEGPVLNLTYTLWRSLIETFLELDSHERVRLLTTEPARGGVRWWFACPFTIEGERCERRVAKLYLPPGEDRFGCRQCHDLAYESSQESHMTDKLAATVAAVDTSGEATEYFKKYLAHLAKEGRHRRKKRAMSPGLFDVFEEEFGLGKGD